jgi:hypothetical protein
MTYVIVGLVVFQAYPLSLCEPLGEGARVLAKIFDRRVRAFGFGCVHTDQAHTFTRAKQERIAVCSCKSTRPGVTSPADFEYVQRVVKRQ